MKLLKMQIIERKFQNMLKEIFTNVPKYIQFWIKKENNKPNVTHRHMFWGRGFLLELGHLDKHLPTTQERKASQGKKIFFFFAWKLLKIAF